MQKAIHVSSVCSSILDVILFACVFSSTCKLMLELRKNKGNLGWKGLLVVGLVDVKCRLLEYFWGK